MSQLARIFFFLGLAFQALPERGRAAVPCNETATCERLYRPGSVCIDGSCSNPFAQGCLRRMFGEASHPKRVCNSDDPPDALISGQCSKSSFDYPEVRVLNQNWESPMFLSWIYQILLSERLEVPVSIETGSAKAKFSFYDIDNAFDYGTLYDYDALRKANQAGGCISSTRKEDPDAYTPCAHVMPEVWDGQREAWKDLEDEGIIEPVEGNGVLGKLSWYVPKFLADMDETLFTYHGLQGEANRRKVAETFKRPTTWLDYCRKVSPTSCLSNDGIATRNPQSEDEGESYYVEGMYKGHFRYTDKNNCTLHPDSCSGHFTDVTCRWSTYTTSQIYWNNIALESDGPLEQNRGYPYDSVVQIYKAAVATGSAVILYFYRPDPNLQSFQGGSAEFETVLLPSPTQECKDARVSVDERCSGDPEVRRGQAPGSCDTESHSFKKLIVSSLSRNTYAVAEAKRSPAYETLNRIRVSNLEIEAIYSAWYNRSIDRTFDAREAVCSWVADNLEDLERFILRGYPREIRTSPYNVGYMYGAISVGLFVALVVVSAGVATYYWRRRRVMVYAQYHFMILILMGFVLVSAGAVVFALRPSNASCISRQWLVTLGYTMGLVPLLVKVAAINKLFQEMSRSNRLKLSPVQLFRDVALCMFLVTVFLVVWTIVDPPKAVENLDLLEEGGNVVEVTFDCTSSSNAWIIVAYGWEVLLLVCATVLAVQTRGAKEEFSESRCVGNLVYSHFLFLILRLTTYLLSSVVRPNLRAGITSFLLSFDTLCAVIIYFAPKFVAAASDGNDLRSSRRISRRPRQKTWSEVVSNHSNLSDATRDEVALQESAIYYDTRVLDASLPPISEEKAKSAISKSLESDHSGAQSENSSEGTHSGGTCPPWIQGLHELQL